METLDKFAATALGLIPSAAVVVVTLVVLYGVRLIVGRRSAGSESHQFRLQLTTLLISFIGVLAVVLLLPVSEGTVGQLLSLLGLLLSAAIALSATTFVGNIMAGLMLRAVRNFRSGDFVRVESYFGRVSERGLFHIEIQTEDRDLTTLPNLYLVTHPVKVVRASGTLVTAEVSLGYDIPRHQIEKALLRAAEEAGLTEPFVQLIDLGDFSVKYRISGLLTEVKSLLTTRSRLREKMLDCLHSEGIEIVSPTFMNQRQIAPDRSFVPSSAPQGTDDIRSELPEAVVFDKADEAESLENLRERLQSLRDEAKSLKERRDSAEGEARRAELTRIMESLETRTKRLSDYIEEREKRSE